jgi:recombination protein RecR
MDALSRLITALRCLPGVGPKSAQRMAYNLLNKQRERGLLLANCLQEAMTTIHHCSRCNNYTSLDVCVLCNNPKRDVTTLCIVESPMDINAIEHSQAFQGCYFVLQGKISPLDGIGAEDIGLPKLEKIIQEGIVKEVILALSPSIEGLTTSHFIHELLRNQPIKVSQLAQGIPSGGELEFLDGNTIGSALRNRAAF